MSLANDLHIRIEPVPPEAMSDALGVWLYARGVCGEDAHRMAVVVAEPPKDADEGGPAGLLGPPAAISLLNQLWQHGFRPSKSVAPELYRPKATAERCSRDELDDLVHRQPPPQGVPWASLRDDLIASLQDQVAFLRGLVTRLTGKQEVR